MNRRTCSWIELFLPFFSFSSLFFRPIKNCQWVKASHSHHQPGSATPRTCKATHGSSQAALRSLLEWARVGFCFLGELRRPLLGCGLLRLLASCVLIPHIRLSGCGALACLLVWWELAIVCSLWLNLGAITLFVPGVGSVNKMRNKLRPRTPARDCIEPPVECCTSMWLLRILSTGAITTRFCFTLFYLLWLTVAYFFSAWWKIS